MTVDDLILILRGSWFSIEGHTGQDREDEVDRIIEDACDPGLPAIEPDADLHDVEDGGEVEEGDEDQGCHHGGLGEGQDLLLLESWWTTERYSYLFSPCKNILSTCMAEHRVLCSIFPQDLDKFQYRNWDQKNIATES